MANGVGRASISIRGATRTRLREFAEDHGAQLDAIAELVIARAIGISIDHLPERVQQFASLVPASAR